MEKLQGIGHLNRAPHFVAAAEQGTRKKKQSLHLHTFIYGVEHCTAVCLWVVFIWILWSALPRDMYNDFATWVRYLSGVDEVPQTRFIMNVPYEGLSYYKMLMDCTFHLFFAYVLFGPFAVTLAHKYQTILAECRKTEDDPNSPPACLPQYFELKGCLLERLGKIPEARAQLDQLKRTWDTQDDEQAFRLDHYLWMAFDGSEDALLTESWRTCFGLIILAIVGIIFSYYLLVPYGFFLVPFLILQLVLSAAKIPFSKRLYAQALDPGCDKAIGGWDIRSFSRLVQVNKIMFCYTFARFIMSPMFIYEFPGWALVLAIMYVVLFVILWLRAATDVSDIVMALAFIPSDQVRDKYLKRMVAESEELSVSPRTGRSSVPVHRAV